MDRLYIYHQNVVQGFAQVTNRLRLSPVNVSADYLKLIPVLFLFLYSYVSNCKDHENIPI